jgi:hypothetical protein
MAYIYDLTDTWNAGGTTFNAIKMNVTDSASASASKLVTLQTNGTEHFSVTKGGQGYFSGNVGIGTASPAYRLDVKSGGAYQASFQSTDAGGSGGLRTFNSGGTAGIALLTYGPSYVGGSLASVGANGSAVAQTGNAPLFVGTDIGVSQPLYLGTGGSERMRITSTGFVGIGATSPDAVLTVFNPATFNARTSGINVHRPSSFGQYGSFAYDGDATYFSSTYTGGGPGAYGRFLFLAYDNGGVPAERMTIDGSGNVGIGTSSIAYTTSGRTTVYTNGTSSSLLGLGVGGTEAGYVGAFSSTALEIAAAGASRSMVLTTNGAERARITPSGDLCVFGGSGLFSLSGRGNITIGGTASSILALGTSASTSTYLYHDLVSSNAELWNTADGFLRFATNNQERVRIMNTGELLVGKTTASFTTAGSSIFAGIINSAGTTDYWNTYNTSAGAYRFYVSSGGTIFATSTSISAISDQRLKENVRDLDAGLDKILALKPRRFDWKEGKGKDVRDDMGFIAQEVEEVLPELIGGWKASEGEPDDLKSVKAGDLIPVLVKAIQELTARVAQLEGN